MTSGRSIFGVRISVTPYTLIYTVSLNYHKDVTQNTFFYTKIHQFFSINFFFLLDPELIKIKQIGEFSLEENAKMS